MDAFAATGDAEDVVVAVVVVANSPIHRERVERAPSSAHARLRCVLVDARQRGPLALRSRVQIDAPTVAKAEAVAHEAERHGVVVDAREDARTDANARVRGPNARSVEADPHADGGDELREHARAAAWDEASEGEDD